MKWKSRTPQEGMIMTRLGHCSSYSNGAPRLPSSEPSLWSLRLSWPSCLIPETIIICPPLQASSCPWKYMKINENLWVYENWKNLWKWKQTMKINQEQWKSMKTNGNTWKSLKAIRINEKIMLKLNISALGWAWNESLELPKRAWSWLGWGTVQATPMVLPGSPPPNHQYDHYGSPGPPASSQKPS